MSHPQPGRYLQLFEELDINTIADRRIAYYTLNDYFGAVFAHVGRKKFRLLTQDFDKNIAHQWEKIKSRLEEIDEEIPERYDEAVKSTAYIRNDIAHDFELSPNKDRILQAYEIAEEFTEWIFNVADEFAEYDENLTAVESLIRIGRRNLDPILALDEEYSKYDLDEEATELQRQAEQYSDQLDDFEDEEEIQKGLVEIVADILELKDRKSSLNYELWKREIYEQEYRAENTYTLYVVEPYDETGQIFFVRDEPAQPEQTFLIDPEHPDTPDTIIEELINLNEGDRIRALVGNKVYMNSKGEKVNMYFIEELIGIE